MVRKIVIVDESNSEFSPDRSESLLKRLVGDCPLEAPDLPDISWHSEICAAKDLKARIGEFWLAWVHDGGSGVELTSITDAAVAQERAAPGALPTVIVCYGGGVASTYPPRGRKVTKQMKAVASRILWTREFDPVESFAQGSAAEWNLEGFLRSVASSFPSVDHSQLILLCDKTDESGDLSFASVAHSTEPLVRLLERDMLEAIKGSSSASDRFLGKAETVIRAIDHLQSVMSKTFSDESAVQPVGRLMLNLSRLRHLVEKLQESKDWVAADYEEGVAILNSLNSDCKELRAVPSVQITQ